MGMLRRRMPSIGAVLAAVLLLAACAPGEPIPSAPVDPGGSVGTATWGERAGTWGHAREGRPHLVIESDGSLGGHDGCNGFGGRWSVGTDGVVVFEDVVMSLVMCEGMDTWLTSGQYAVPQGDRILILDGDRREIGTLPRTR